jgi:hypothetical protein
MCAFESSRNMSAMAINNHQLEVFWSPLRRNGEIAVTGPGVRILPTGPELDIQTQGAANPLGLFEIPLD